MIIFKQFPAMKTIAKEAEQYIKTLIRSEKINSWTSSLR